MVMKELNEMTDIEILVMLDNAIEDMTQEEYDTIFKKEIEVPSLPEAKPPEEASTYSLLGDANEPLNQNVSLLLSDLLEIFEEYSEYKSVFGFKIIEPIKPSHGSCCTCQNCGRNYDDCACLHNQIVIALNKIIVRRVSFA